ncbi:MAG TPA: hypothetical protein VFR18_09655 [Terriglobia bacterium]|nr:hypothetical protein [Terriglobia bacterium]
MKATVRKSLLPITFVILLTSVEAFGQKVVMVEGEPQGIDKTRGELHAIVSQYPPKLGEVLRMDHSLLSNDSYLAPYPDLRTFLQRHPEVLRDPDYFVGNSSNELQDLRNELENSFRRRDSAVENILDVIFPMSLLLMAVMVVMWIVRNVSDHRRWLRVWRAQSEAHSKLMDRLTNNEQLLAYLQSPAGKRFFESSSMPVDFGPRPSVPAGRIIWSVQVGLVLALGGIALQLVKGDPQLTPDDVSGIHILSVLAIGLGISFIVGAATSYMISAKLGLLEQPVRRQPSSVEPPI